MATSSNVILRQYDPLGIVQVKVDSGTVIAPGDLLDFSTADTEVLCHGGDTSFFMGIAMEGSESGDTRPISIATRGVVNCKLYASSTNVLIGDGVKYQAGANGTVWQLTKATSEGIMWANEAITAGNNGDFYFDSHVLNFIWDALTEG